MFSCGAENISEESEETFEIAGGVLGIVLEIVLSILFSYPYYCLTARRIQDLGGKYFWFAKPNPNSTIQQIKVIAAILLVLERVVGILEIKSVSVVFPLEN